MSRHLAYGSTNPLKQGCEEWWKQCEFIFQEKIDGSNALYSVLPNQLIEVACRGADKKPNDTLFGALFRALGPELQEKNPEYIYCGEYVPKLRHNQITYERLPKQLHVTWDIRRKDTNEYLDLKEMTEECERLGMDYTKPIYHFKPNQDQSFVHPYTWAHRFIDKVNNPSYQPMYDWESTLPDYKPLLGGKIIEGVVIKILRFAPLPEDMEWQPVSRVTKVVATQFKERQKGGKKPSSSSSSSSVQEKQTLESIAFDMGKTFDSPARYEKALQHLKEKSCDSTLLDLLTTTQDFLHPLVQEAMAEELAADLIKEKKDSIDSFLFYSVACEIALTIPGIFAHTYLADQTIPPKEQMSQLSLNKEIAISYAKEEVYYLGYTLATSELYEKVLDKNIKNVQTHQKRLKEYLRNSYKSDITNKLFLIFGYHIFAGASASLETFLQSKQNSA